MYEKQQTIDRELVALGQHLSDAEATSSAIEGAMDHFERMPIRLDVSAAEEAADRAAGAVCRGGRGGVGKR